MTTPNQQSLLLGVNIVLTYVKQTEGLDDLSLEDKARLCFREALKESSTWFVPRDDHDTLFRIGLGAMLTILSDDSEARARVEKTLAIMKTLNAAFSGVEVLFPEEDDIEPLPLGDLFKEVLGEDR